MSCGFSTGTHPGQKHRTYFHFSAEQKNVRGLTWRHASLRKVRFNYVRGQSLWHQQCFPWVCTKWVSWTAFGATAEVNQLVKGQKKQQPKQIISVSKCGDLHNEVESHLTGGQRRSLHPSANTKDDLGLVPRFSFCIGQKMCCSKFPPQKISKGWGGSDSSLLVRTNALSECIPQ